MISATLPPIRPDATLDFSEAGEAFALTMLASYNNLDDASRYVESFKRAFGMQSITFLPRSPGVRPAAVLAAWAPDPYPRVVLAIEGAFSPSQYTQFAWQSDGIGVTGCQGRVFSAFNTYATGMQEAIASVWPFNLSPLLRGVFQITFAGYSLGAAVAEILANRWANAYAGRFKLMTFGKPRVGNYRWLANRNLQLRQTNIINNRDPISCIPGMGPTHVTEFLSAWPTLWTFFQRDHLAVRFDYAGEQLSAYGPFQEMSEIQAVRESFRPFNVNNAWGDHSMLQYWLTLQNHFERDNQRMAYRMRWLEFPNQTAFGPFYDGQRGVTDALEGPAAPYADVQPPAAWLSGGGEIAPQGHTVITDEIDTGEPAIEAPPARRTFNVETTTQTNLRRNRFR